MPEHGIKVHLTQPLDVLNADLVIQIDSDQEKLGELRISRGSIDWVPRGAKLPLSLEWERFDQVMRENGRRRRLRL